MYHVTCVCKYHVRNCAMEDQYIMYCVCIMSRMYHVSCMSHEVYVLCKVYLRCMYYVRCTLHLRCMYHVKYIHKHRPLGKSYVLEEFLIYI